MLSVDTDFTPVREIGHCFIQLILIGCKIPVGYRVGTGNQFIFRITEKYHPLLCGVGFLKYGIQVISQYAYTLDSKEPAGVMGASDRPEHRNHSCVGAGFVWSGDILRREPYKGHLIL